MDNPHAYVDDSASPDTTHSYAFLNHSSSTLTNHLPPSVDDKPLARQKRKRTSPEDQTILEAAYKRDPKPDKAARVELVKRVSLGEKEVQIWFQNRRQSSRRRSRPLLPHEIAQYQMARLNSTSNQSPPQQHDSGFSPDEGLDTEQHDAEKQPQDAVSQASITATNTDHATSASPVQAHVPAIDRRLIQTHAERALPYDVLDLPRPAASPHASLQDDSRSLGYLANRRSASSLHNDQNVQDMQPPPQPNSTPDSSRRLRKAPSIVRLSMSFDGNASVVTKDGSSPSPPRATPVMMTATSGIPMPQIQIGNADQDDDTNTPKTLQRSSSGRSRDSRAWEFWCDRDARTELEDKAEKDSSGSAADAIGLLRSASGRSILGSLPTKRNSLFSRQESESKRVRLDEKRPPLQRANTSMGRLQSRKNGSTITKSKLKHSSSAVSMYLPGNESDKENWSPDSDRPHASQPPDHRSLSSQHRKGGLTESRSAGNTDKTGARSGANQKTKRLLDGENADPEADVELAAFMRGGRKSNATSSEDDLDCVQGLLSLSQGNWR